jgi:hypothetical protein
MQVLKFTTHWQNSRVAGIESKRLGFGKALTIQVETELICKENTVMNFHKINLKNS